MLIYLAQAIDKSPQFAEDERHNELYHQMLKDWPGGASLVIFRPAGAFRAIPGRVTQDEGRRVEEINTKALKEADAMVILYEPGVESWGVPMELLAFRNTGRPAFLLIEGHGTRYEDLPIYLRNRIPERLVQYSVESLVQELSEFA
jgi:hypothetical protein